MCFPTLTAVGSLFLLFSFIIELFILIGNLPSTFLPGIYFAKAFSRSQNLSYSFGLWNYCQGDGSGVVSSCSSSSAAYNWAKTPNISNIAPTAAHSYVASGLFLGMFILFFIGCGFSFVFWCFSLPICCVKRRGLGYSMSTLVLTTFCVMLTAFILSLVVIFLGIKAVTGQDGWGAEVGNSLWLTISALVSLMISFLCYTGGTTCGRPGKKRRNKNAIDPNFKDGNPNSSQPLYMASPVFVPQHGAQTNGGQGMLQQPYSPNTTGAVHQQNYDTQGHVGHTGNTPHTPNQSHDPNSVSVPMHGYQTPTLEPANTAPPH
ncbi:uncharacterized protein EV154DRAFT_593282 [Mucor mucedo]|uniref:uncharacterized protein n=1 Tax=Mucor mucedo TaxID=29922 RepID=UPI00221FDB5E|nr:uncharacterized protein EV154DRAFT_593282 [Mucor mucedo]KAI7895971.1 hypothetical protein EV154DRAFT_593282 [Mucor mucedo]